MTKEKSLYADRDNRDNRDAYRLFFCPKKKRRAFPPFMGEQRMSYLRDGRTKRQILLSIERKLENLIGEYEMDLYDRIIAGVSAIQSGDNQALEQHVAAIDTHLSAIDASELQLQGDDTASKGRLDAIEAGLGKIADAVAPAPAGGTSTPPASGGTSTPPASGAGTTSTPPSDGSQSADVGPGGPAPAAVPAAGAGSAQTGQVDTPVTTR